jgi:hypothetical protein
MSENLQFRFQNFQPEAMMATTQRSLACWSRAWSQLAQGMMSASAAQMEVARSLCTVQPIDWEQLSSPAASATAPAAAAHWYLDGAKTRFGLAIGAYRRSSDVLADSLFSAAATLLAGIEEAPLAAAPELPQQSEPRAVNRKAA